MEVKKHRIFNVFYAERGKNKILLTENLIPNKKHFDEELIKYNGKEFRVWDPKRSKLASIILKGSLDIGLRKDNTVLYLGSSHGYTISYVSDIVGKEGLVFAVDMVPRVMRDLVFAAEKRQNIAPVLADANKPESFVGRVSQVDVLYQDIAQKNQVSIFLKNIDLFLKDGGYALFAVKARSIDVTQKPKEIFNGIRKELEDKVKIIDFRILEPFQRDHCMFVCKK